MKIRRFEATNFRHMRDVSIPFSTTDGRHLTVVRAENETGKTTLLEALKWVLYGEAGLPGGGRQFRIAPIDWANEEPVEISVCLEFEIDSAIGRDHASTVSKVYRLIREARETPHTALDEVERRTAEAKLFELTPQGHEPVDSPQHFLNNEIPVSLKDVFFTDGDRALTFLAADRSAGARRQVENAMRALLGIGLVESAMKHVRVFESSVRRGLAGDDGDKRAAELGQRVDSLEGQLSTGEEKLSQLLDKLETVTRQQKEAKDRLFHALRQGNRDDLAKSLQSTEQSIEHLARTLQQTEKARSGLLEDKELCVALARGAAGKGQEALDALKQTGDIPSGMIPILEERLRIEECFCGTTLRKGSNEGEKARQTIKALIVEQRKHDALKQALTELYYRQGEFSKPWRAAEDWNRRAIELEEHQLQLTRDQEALYKQKAETEALLRALPETDIRQLQDQVDAWEKQRDQLNRESAEQQARNGTLRDDLQEAKGVLAVAIKRDSKLLRARSKLEGAQDMLTVLEGVHQSLMGEELEKVSQRMNQMFMEIIGNDEEQRETVALIRRAEITTEYDIKVFGPHGRMLHPDQDLNGASRRALTFAFILGLQQVTDVGAPNIIDTPLGMMSGQLKQQAVSTACEGASQLVLFLTRDEIHGCEEVLDRYASEVVTLTNTAHYPKYLVQDPHRPHAEVLVCPCGYREYCDICERKGDTSELALDQRRMVSDAVR